MRLGFKCWKCGARATIQKVQTINPTLMEVGYACTNLDCGHTFVAGVQAIRTLSPGAYPSPPGVSVPISKHVARRRLMTELSLLPTAERGGFSPAPAHVGQTDLFDALALPALVGQGQGLGTSTSTSTSSGNTATASPRLQPHKLSAGITRYGPSPMPSRRRRKPTG